MVIQSYNVSVSSQRSMLSLQSTTATSARDLNSAVYAVTTGQEGSTETTPDKAAKHQGQNGNTQGQGRDHNQNTQGQNVNNQGQRVTNKGLNQGKQGQNVDNRRQSNRDVFRTMLKNAGVGTVDRPVRRSPVSQVLGAVYYKTPANPQELRARLSQLLYELLTGKLLKQKSKPYRYAENISAGFGSDTYRDFNFIGDITAFGGVFGIDSLQRSQGIAGWRAEGFHYEAETVSYQASGIIHTADGRTVTVDINMQMSREFVSFMGISADAMMLFDPLVINYGGTATSLMGEKFMFDLTMDGELDSLSVLGEGSGFLAIDRNGDGKINDGSELFGPSTGCGFSELRKYDTDGNGWIDENDEVFDKLVVWSRDKDGNDTVYTLMELGIGAIFLGDISTDFSFMSESNETLGVMRSTSFFIKQCGGAGTLSHIDLNL